MKKLGFLALIVILSSVTASIASSISLISIVHAKPLASELEATDLNIDGNVTLLDLTGFAGIYGWNSTNPGWNMPIHTGWRNASAADFNNDTMIGLPDLVTLAYCYSLNRTA